MKSRLSILMLASASLSSTPVHSDTLAPAELPLYQQGDTFIFDNYRVEYVVYAEHPAPEIEWRSRLDHHYRSNRNFIVPILQSQIANRSSQRTVIGNPDALWPLKPGNEVRFRVFSEMSDKHSHSQHRELQLWHCYVEPAKDVKISAGTFSTLPVLCDQYSANSMRPFKRISWFYAPIIGHYVKRSSYSLITGESTTFSLFATLPGNQANGPRIQALLNQIEPPPKE